MKAPVLFNRRLDELVLVKISPQTNTKSYANDYYKLILPFVNGIPPEKLLELRSKIPSAFLDFRSLMFEIIHDFEKSKVEREVLELKIQ